jgi:hypothetical protein
VGTSRDWEVPTGKDAKEPVERCLSMFRNIMRQITANHLRWASEGRPLSEGSADISIQTRQKGGIYYSTKTIYSEEKVSIHQGMKGGRG